MDAYGDEAPSRQLTDYAGVLRRRWWQIVATALLGIVLAAAATLLMPVRYTSAVSVQVTPTGLPDANTTTTNARTSGAVNLDNEAQLVKSTPVVTRAAQLLNLPGQVGQLPSRVTVSTPANTQILDIGYQASTAAGAQAGAAAFGQAYLDVRTDSARAALDSKVQAMRAQLDALVNQLRDVSGKVATLPSSSPDRAFSTAQQSVLSQQIGTLNTQLAQLQGTPITPGQVVSDAPRPSSPSSPVWSINLASGAVAGALLGVLLVMFNARSRPNRRIHNAEDLAGVFDGPVVTAPTVGRGRGAVHDRRAARKQYQQIANGVLFLGQRQPTVVAVTGVTSGPSGAFAAAGVAEAVARAGLRVALVDADLESGTLSALAAAENVPGLSEVLLDGRPVEEVAHATRDPGYELVPVGSRGIEAARTGPVNRLRSVITNLRRSVDVVVVTAPSTADSLDAQLLAGIADGVVVAMEAGRTQQGEVEDAADQMQVVGANVLGGVLLASGRGQGRGQGRNSRSGSAIRHRALGSASNRQSQQTATDDLRSSSLSADLLGGRNEPDAGSDVSSGASAGVTATGSSAVAPPMQGSAYRSENEGLTRSAWPTGADARD